MKKIINKGIFKSIMLREAARWNLTQPHQRHKQDVCAQKRQAARNNAIKLKERAFDTTGEGYVEVAVKIIIAVVIGGLLLTGLIFLFNVIIMPRIESEVTSMFDAGGNTP